jgi:hypothetical protein
MDAVIPYLLVFVAVAALDFVWAFYTRACANGWAGVGALLAGGIILLSGSAQIGYTHDPYLLAPAVLGAIVGTWSALRLAKRS